nr:hypothetical protein Iba_chr02dCG1250 [Ipomoea batatas]
MTVTTAMLPKRPFPKCVEAGMYRSLHRHLGKRSELVRERCRTFLGLGSVEQRKTEVRMEASRCFHSNGRSLPFVFSSNNGVGMRKGGMKSKFHRADRQHTASAYRDESVPGLGRIDAHHARDDGDSGGTPSGLAYPPQTLGAGVRGC